MVSFFLATCTCNRVELQVKNSPSFSAFVRRHRSSHDMGVVWYGLAGGASEFELEISIDNVDG